jgi:hypothetical protein
VDSPLLFDGNNQPKSAFHAVIAEAQKVSKTTPSEAQ